MSSWQRRMVFIPLCLLITALMSGATARLPVRAEVNDTPTPVVTENTLPVTDWIVEEGLLYWARRCPGDEFLGPGYLRRMPIGGGTSQTLSTTDEDSCQTFAAMTAEPEGLYDYSFEELAIFFRPSASPLDPPTLIFDTADAPAGGTQIVTDADYLYWISYNFTDGAEIHRVKKDGTGYQSLYTGSDTPYRIKMLFGMVVWADSAGIWYLPPCTSPPCTRNNLGSAPGMYLDAYSTGFFTFDLYWTDTAATPDRIMKASCNYFLAIAPNPPGLGCSSATPIYTAPDATWNVGQVRRSGSNLFWAERLAGVGPTDGRIRRMVATGGTPQDILTNARLMDDELAIDSLWVYFATVADDPSGYDSGIFKLPLDASAIVRDLRADWFEVTQGIQNRGNTVQLVADKTTYVRGYALQASGPDTPIVHAVLHGTRSGNPLPGSPLLPSNGTRSLGTGVSYDRGTLDSSWLFALPASWTTAGTTDLRLEVDSVHAYPDPAPGNNSVSQSLNFIAKAPVCTVFVPVRTSAPTPYTSDPNFGAFVNMAQRLWPTRAYWPYYQDEDVAELEACWWGPFPYPCFGPYELPDDTWKVLLSLKTRDVFTDDPDECDDAGAITHYVGMVHPSTNTGSTNGAGYMGQSAAWVKLPEHSPTTSDAFDFPRKGGTLAHELGHNADRMHVDCGGPEGPDPGYPYPTNQIANVGQSSYYGFDVRTLTVLEPTDVADLMGYCQPRWPSDYTWRALFSWLDAGASTATNDSALAAAANAVYASGSVAAAGGSGTLSYAYMYPTAAMNASMLDEWSGLMGQAAASDASYSIQVKDAGGNVIAVAPVTLLVASDDPPGSNEAFVTVFPASVTPGAKLELLENSTVLTSLTMGPLVPAVTVSQPAAAEVVDALLTVTWQATDLNASDVLLFTIQYTPDNGATWISLATDYADGPNTSHTFVLPTPAIPATAGPNQGRIRILASDGYNTGLGESAGFTVVNRKPEVHILTPAPGESFAAGRTVTVRGMAFDAEDGFLTGNALAWQLFGIPVGNGEEVHSAGLAPGVYPLKLIATDSQAASAETTTQLVINTLGIPAGAAPSMDGFCTDEAYTTAVELELFPYSAGDQAIVRLLRTNDHLWACFSGLKPGALTPGAWAAIMVDPNLSRGSAAQTDDAIFGVGENGAVATMHGNGAGLWVTPGPGGLAAQVGKLGERWSAELRIDKSVLGGWDKMVGLAAAHLYVANSSNSYFWPHIMFATVPDTWASIALGDQPLLHNIVPASVEMLSSGFTLAVNGENFVDGAVVLYNATALPTTFVDGTKLTAPISADKLLLPGVATIQVRASESSPLVSNPISFTVTAHAPTITSLTPAQKNAGDPAFVLGVLGPGFHEIDTVYWNDQPLETTLVNEGQLNAVVPAGLLSQGGVANITVYCAGPEGGAMSNTVQLSIVPHAKLITYMPSVEKH